MKIGVIFPQIEFGHDPTAVKDYAQAAEELGFSHIAAYEHILGVNPDRPGGWDWPFTYESSFLEPFTMFSYMAGATSKIGFSTRILILPQRQTALVAKQAATLDVFCNGKFSLGVGLGWNEAEYISQGEDFFNRAIRMEEQVDVLRKLWTEPLMEFKGQYHQIPDAGINPLPVQRPIPIWFGGHSDQTLQRVARMGDGWLPNDLPIDETKVLIAQLQEYAADNQRDFSSIGIDARLPYQLEAGESWEKAVESWKDAGATQLSLDTMFIGISSPEDHIRSLRTFSEAIGLRDN
jgi:probable F420-dependent oxidoreductase